MRILKTIGILLVCVLCASTAFAVDIYYSVGTNGGDFNAAATVDVAGGNTATFSSAQPETIGAGDRVTYNSSSVMYIQARLSPTQFTVATAMGGAVGNGGSWAVNSIERTFTTLNNAVNTGAIPNPSDALYLATTDLTSGPYTLYIVCYGDAIADTTAVNISGWITDGTSYMHILPSGEARKKGRWDAGAYRLVITSGDAITVNDDNVMISGVQIELSASADDGIVSDAGNDNLRITENIIHYTGANPANSLGILLDDDGSAGTTAKVWNNIIYDFLGTGNAGISVVFSGSGSRAYLYNNTVYNNMTGINDVSGSSSIVAKNTIAYGNGDNYGGLGTFDAASCNNLSGPDTDAQIPGTGAQNGEAVGFIDVAGGDFRLAANDAAAQDNGAPLNADANLSFSIDIEEQARGRLWDIGADERAARMLRVASAANPVVVQIGDGTVAEDFRITFTNAANGLDIVERGGYGADWGSDLISTGTLFTAGGETGATLHTVVESGAGEVIIRKARSGVLSHYHIFPSGRIVLDAAGASSVTVNQTATFSEYSDGVAHAGGYHAYADLIETASTSSSDYLSPDTPDAIAGARVSDRAFDYTADGFEEGRGSYSVIAFSGSATVDFDGDAQTRYAPVLLLEEFYPKTAPVSALTLYWDATDTTASGSETWTGALTSVLTASMGLRGTAQENDSAGDYASVQTSLNIGDPGTLSLWVRSSSAINPAANEYIFFADTDMNLYFDTSGQLNFRINAGVDLTYAADIYDYSWHQVTCTWDYTTDEYEYALYVDGKPRARSTAAYAVPTLDGTMVFTAANAAGVSRFSGAIDELRIYNGVEKPTGHVLFHSRMDSAADMTIPQEGNAATVNGTASFTAGVRGSAITFDAAGEYATVPSAGNINASAGTLEMWVKSNVEGNPSVDEQLFFGDAAFNIFFDSDGRINFEISSGVHLTDAADTYDGLWHHVRAMWNYANGQYLLYVDGVQVASSLAVYAMPTIDDVMMYLGAVDAADTNRYNGLIDGFLIYDAMILPYGAYNVPAAWGDAAGKADSTVLLYWDADSTTLNVGTGSATLGGSITAASAINGSGLVNDSAGEYASFVSTGNIINSEGSLGFWVKSDVTGNPSGVEYLLYAGTDFNVFFDALGFVNFNISSGVNLQHALDIYDARWHFVRCTWNYDDDLYELFVDGVRSASTTNAYTAPALDAVAYVTALNSSGTNRFDGSLDELYVTDSASTPVTATAYGQPVMQPQAAAPYSYRVDVGSNLDGLASGDRLTPLSDFTVSATNSPSEYILEYLGNIATTGSPSISATSATQNANATTVTISYTGTDPDNDTVTYTAVDCEYSLDSTDGANGTWNDMTTTSGTTESFTSAGVSLSYVWNAASDTNVYDGIVYLRLTVKDGIGHASKAVSIAPIAVDTLAPSGLGNFNINGTATTMITVAWDTVTDDNWLNDAHYEIWYGIVQADVQTCSGTALKWDHAFDGGLANRAATTTTITNLAPETTYFFKIWAVDGFANEATVADITGDTNESPNENIYDIQIDPIYDSANDAILITTSLLMRSGSIVTDLTDITLTYVGVLNNAGILLSGNLNGAGDTVEGTTSAIFYTTWNPAAGLSADTAYTVISKISYNGENFSGVRTLTVDRLGSVTQDLLLVDHQTSGLLSSTSSVGAKISAFSASFDDHEDEQVTFRDTRQQELASIETEVGVIAEDTTADLTGFVEDEFADETAKGVQTEIITRGTTVVTGSTVTIRFRTVTGASPVVTVYDSKNVTRTINAAMTENGTTGIYAYNVDFKTTWGLGDFTVLVREPASGSVDSIVMSVVQSLTTGGGGETTSSSISTDLIYSRLSNMDGDITSLVEGMSDVNTVTADVSSDIELLLEKLGSAQLAGPMEAQTMTDILGAVGAVIGEEGGVGEFETILGRLSNLEGMLVGIGLNASVAATLTGDSKGKAKYIREMAARVQALMDEGDLEAAEAELLSLGEHLVGLKEDMDKVPGSVTTNALSREMQGMIGEVNQMAAEKGITDLIPPIEFNEGGSAVNPEDIIAVRNDVSELKSLMDEVRTFMDQEINKPIIHAWFEGD